VPSRLRPKPPTKVQAFKNYRWLLLLPLQLPPLLLLLLLLLLFSKCVLMQLPSLPSSPPPPPLFSNQLPKTPMMSTTLPCFSSFTSSIDLSTSVPTLVRLY
jgi:hypothetical protein